MTQIHTLIIGASVSGLASAAALQHAGMPYIIIEKQGQAAVPWRNHYNRLHLHTPKNLSGLPFKKFGSAIPRYPSRQQVVDYLDDYQKEYNINPVFNTQAIAIKKEGGYWVTETSNGNFVSQYLIIATGRYGEPKDINFKGIQTFTGKVMHSAAYKTGKCFEGKKVLVVGFGNSACEIAIDLYEQGALPSMAVRSAVNIVPRDLLGIPILRLSLLMSRLPVRLADAINAPLVRWLFGDIRKLGLKKMPYGTFEQIKKDGTIPLLDIGTIKHIRQGHIKIYGNISHLFNSTVYFDGGERENFDAIVACIGYSSGLNKILHIDNTRLEDLNVCIDKQKYFGRDGLYFCGFWIAPTGQFREIAADAKKIAASIAKNEKTGKRIAQNEKWN